MRPGRSVSQPRAGSRPRWIKIPDLPGRATRPPPTRARRPRLCKMFGSCWAHVGRTRGPQIPWKSPHPAGRAGGLPWGHPGLGSWPGPIMTVNGSSGCVRHEKVGHTLGKRSVRHRRGRLLRSGVLAQTLGSATLSFVLQSEDGSFKLSSHPRSGRHRGTHWCPRSRVENP